MIRALLLIVAAIVPYLPCLYGNPIYDDYALINNAWIQEGKWKAWIKRNTWRPLTYLSYLLNVKIFGGLGQANSKTAKKHALLGYHSFSMLLHVLNALVLWAALRQFGISTAYETALIYAVHPLCSQGVAYISGRFSVLAATFGFAGIGLLGANHPILACIAVGLACLAKEDAAALYPLLSLLAIVFSKGWLAVILPMVIFTAAVVYMRRAIMEMYRSSGATNLEDCGFPPALKSPVYQWTAFTEHLWRLPGWALGYGQSFDHAIQPLRYKRVLPACVLFIALQTLASANPEFSLAFLLFFAPLVPYLLIPMPDPVAEQRLVISTAGIAIILGRIPLVFPVLVLIFASMTACRAWIYRSNLDTWLSVIRDGGRQDRALINIGCDYLERGDLKWAWTYSKEALAINPNLAMARANIAVVEQQWKHMDESVVQFTEAVTRSPRFYHGFYLLGRVLETVNRVDEAFEAYSRCLAIKEHPSSRNRLGLIHLRRGNLTEAANCFRLAASNDPNTIAFTYNRAVVLQFTGKKDESIEHFKKLPKQFQLNDDMVIVQKAQ